MTEDGWKKRIRIREIYRYMGMRESEADESLQMTVEKQLERLLSTVRVRCFRQQYPLTVRDQRYITLGPMDIDSQALARNLRGCDQAVLMGVTLGVETDRLIYRLETSAVGEAVITDACAAAVVEAVCDEVCSDIQLEAKARGHLSRPRFSPGFADFTLDYQKKLLDVLQLPRRIGVTLTDGGMMTPSKSVTAVVGLYQMSAEDTAPAHDPKTDA